MAGTYKKECVQAGKKYFSVASGGGTGRTLHPDNMHAGPASYGMTDTMGRMHSDAQFAGSSSVPAHVEMMGLIGMGNNPMVGASVAVAVGYIPAAALGIPVGVALLMGLAVVAGWTIIVGRPVDIDAAHPQE